MPELFVAEELQDYLVAQGVAQLPAAAPSATLPSVWLAPRDGTPEPRPPETATISIVEANTGVRNDLEAWIEESFVDLYVRATNNGAAKLLQRQIRALIHPNDAYGGRHMWMMSDLLVEYSTVWRGDQPVEQDQYTYTRVQGLRFGCRRKALAGLPTVP